MRRLVLALGFVAATAGIAGANGRPAGTSTINFQQGNPQHIAAGMTFGFLVICMVLVWWIFKTGYRLRN